MLTPSSKTHVPLVIDGNIGSANITNEQLRIPLYRRGKTSLVYLLNLHARLAAPILPINRFETTISH